MAMCRNDSLFPFYHAVLCCDILLSRQIQSHKRLLRPVTLTCGVSHCERSHTRPVQILASCYIPCDKTVATSDTPILVIFLGHLRAEQGREAQKNEAGKQQQRQRQRQQGALLKCLGSTKPKAAASNSWGT
eukprot:4362253-Amphidinium_carterae.1